MTPAAPTRIQLSLERTDFQLAAHLELPGHGITALFGPSGSGKTTLLRCVAGLEQADQAFITIRGQCWQNSAARFFLPVHRRNLGYVFQEASLFGHLGVRQNLEYGYRRIPARQRRVQFDQAVAWLGLAPLLSKPAPTLSGGERQRVALGRAILTSPDILLLDEPLSALDNRHREEVLPCLERLRDELKIPMLYVSHCLDEVTRLADHLVLLDQGRVVAQGGLTETLARLDLPRHFSEDAGVVLDTCIGLHDDADFLTRLDFADGHIHVGRRHEAVGQRVRCRIQARDVSLCLTCPEATSILNRLPATVVDLVPADTPAHVLVRLNLGTTPLLARITRRSCLQLGIRPGLSLWAQIKAVALLNPARH